MHLTKLTIDLQCFISSSNNKSIMKMKILQYAYFI
jgi:hypothetical protein